MKRNLYLIIFAICVLFGLSSFKTTEDPITNLLKKLAEFASKYPVEKIHLHLDKPYYTLGDDIWFKAYVVDSKTSSPTTISNILYVELINEKNAVEKQLKLPMNMGITSGDFNLTDSLEEGNYRIRAYTQWMRNAGPEFFFDKTIKIGKSWANQISTNTNFQFIEDGKNEKVNASIKFRYNDKPYSFIDVNYRVDLDEKTIHKAQVKTDQDGQINFQFVNDQPTNSKSGNIYVSLALPNKEKVTKVIPINTTSAAIDVQFFPEGGSLIKDLPTRIAVKAINATGNGENIKGVILDENNLAVTTFETSDLGMGSFSLNPMKGKTYKAKTMFSDGREKILDLPKVEDEGYSLNIKITDTANLVAKIAISETLIGKGSLYLLAQQNGQVYFTAKVSTAKNFAIVNLPKHEFPSGILTITLFNAENIPVAERLTFINNKYKLLSLEVDGLESTYNKKGNVKLNLTAKSGEIASMGSFSVAVTNETVVTPDVFNETNIFTDLLLKSDLKGYIEKPNYYFMDDSLKTQIALDHLLLTHGWRKIEWKTFLNNPLPTQTFKAETGLEISGSVTTFGGKPIPNAKITLLSSSPEIFAIDTLTDGNGKFVFKNLNFPDSSKLVLQANNKKGKPDVLIKLDGVPVKQSVNQQNIGEIEVNVNETLKTYLKKSEEYFNDLEKKGLFDKTIRLKKVEITTQKKTAAVTSNLNGSGRADTYISAKQMENSTDITSVLSRNGMTIMNSKVYLYSYLAPPRPMHIIIDGVKIMSDGGMNVLDMNVIEIESIEVLKSPSNTAIYGVFGGAGVLVITTKNGSNQPDYKIDKNGVITFSPKGYAVSRTFYAPRYNVNQHTTSDLRTTVYWNPTILTDEDGQFKLDYFNGDEPGKYRIVIEGFDIDGNLARKVMTYEVK